MRRIHSCWAVPITVLILIPCSALADGFDPFSKHEELRGHLIIDSGDVERVSSPIGQLPISELFKVGSNKCYSPLGSVSSWGFGKRAGLVLMDKDRDIKLAIIESGVGSIKIQSFPVVQMSCQNLNTDRSSPTLEQLQQRLQEQLRLQESLQRESDRLRKSKQ